MFKLIKVKYGIKNGYWYKNIGYYDVINGNKWIFSLKYSIIDNNLNLTTFQLENNIILNSKWTTVLYLL